MPSGCLRARAPSASRPSVWVGTWVYSASASLAVSRSPDAALSTIPVRLISWNSNPFQADLKVRPTRDRHQSKYRADLQVRLATFTETIATAAIGARLPPPPPARRTAPDPRFP